MSGSEIKKHLLSQMLFLAGPTKIRLSGLKGNHVGENDVFSKKIAVPDDRESFSQLSLAERAPVRVLFLNIT